MISSEMLGHFERIVGTVKTRLVNSLARAVVNLVNDGTKMQELQIGVLEDENRGGVERFQNYGFSSVPKAGAEAVVIFPNGDRALGLVVAVDDRRYRPTGGQPGEVTIYTDEGDQVRLARGHVIILTTSGEIRAGSAAAATPVALASELAALKNAFALFTPTSGDGAAIKAIFAAFAAPGATKLKTE